jgi:hypothetical protein
MGLLPGRIEVVDSYTGPTLLPSMPPADPETRQQYSNVLYSIEGQHLSSVSPFVTWHERPKVPVRSTRETKRWKCYGVAERSTLLEASPVDMGSKRAQAVCKTQTM